MRIPSHYSEKITRFFISNLIFDQPGFRFSKIIETSLGTIEPQIGSSWQLSSILPNVTFESKMVENIATLSLDSKKFLATPCQIWTSFWVIPIATGCLGLLIKESVQEKSFSRDVQHVSGFTAKPATATKTLFLSPTFSCRQFWRQEICKLETRQEYLVSRVNHLVLSCRVSSLFFLSPRQEGRMNEHGDVTRSLSPVWTRL